MFDKLTLVVVFEYSHAFSSKYVYRKKEITLGRYLHQI